VIRLTEAELSQYKAIKKEIEDLDQRITDMKQAEVVQFGTVKGSSKYFPYTPMNFHVAGIDPSDAKAREKNISDLLRQREVQRDMLVKKQLEIEKYIENISNSTTRTVFRLYFIDGNSQFQIARKVNYSQGRISQTIKSYLKSNKINN
jgi:DNA-directed RNA polymerase specialized sigma subunit